MYSKAVTSMYIKKTTGIQNLDLTDLLSEQWIAYPQIREQQLICEELNQICATIDRVIAEKEALIADLEAYRKSLIFEVVTGKREVS